MVESRFDPETNTTFFPGTSGFERLGSGDGGGRGTTTEPTLTEFQRKFKESTGRLPTQNEIEREASRGGDITTPSTGAGEISPILKEGPTGQLSVFDPKTSVVSFEGTAAFEEAIASGPLRVQTERGLEFATEARREDIVKARARETALEKISPAIAPETPFRPDVQRERARQAIESLTPEEKELIGFGVREIKAETLQTPEAAIQAINPDLQISRDSIFQKEFTRAEPFATSTIRPEIETFKRLRGEEAAKQTKESLLGLGGAVLDLSIVTGVGAGFGVGFRALRAIGPRATAFSRGLELESALIFGGVTAVDVAKDIKEGRPLNAAETVVLAGGAVAGAAFGFGRAATLEAIRPGARALRGVRGVRTVKVGPPTPAGKATTAEKIQLGVGRRTEVAKTPTEALALQEALGPQSFPDVAFALRTGEFEPQQVGEIETIIGGKRLTRPQFEDITPFKVVGRKFKEGEFTERAVGGEEGFEGLTKIEIKEFVEKGPRTEQKILRREDIVQDVSISVRELAGKPTKRGFLGEEAAEIMGKTRGIQRESTPLERSFDLPELKTDVVPRPSRATRVDIFGERIGSKLTPLTVPVTIEQIETKPITDVGTETEITPLERVTPVARTEVGIDLGLGIGARIEGVLGDEVRPVITTDVFADVGVKPTAAITPAVTPTIDVSLPSDVITIPKPVTGFGFIGKKPPRKTKKKEIRADQSFKVTFKELGQLQRVDPNRFKNKKQAQRYGAYIVDIGPEIGFKTSTSKDPTAEVGIVPEVVSFSRRKFKFKKEGDFFIEKKKHRQDSFGERVLGNINIEGGAAFKLAKDKKVRLISKDFDIRIKGKGGIF